MAAKPRKSPIVPGFRGFAAPEGGRKGSTRARRTKKPCSYVHPGAAPRAARQGCLEDEFQKGPKKTEKVKEPLDQRHLDLIGLGCVLLGIYLVFVLYFGWDGGRLGSGLRDGLQYMIGLVAYAIPLVLFALAAILIFKPSLPTTRPSGRVPVSCSAACCSLSRPAPSGWAARAPIRAYFDAGWFPDHGGVVGESAYWLTATLFQPFGAHLIAVFALLAGLLLLTGSTVAAVLTRSGSAVKKAGTASAGATRVLTRTAVRPEGDATAVIDADQELTEPLAARSGRGLRVRPGARSRSRRRGGSGHCRTAPRTFPGRDRHLGGRGRRSRRSPTRPRSSNRSRSSPGPVVQPLRRTGDLRGEELAAAWAVGTTTAPGPSLTTSTRNSPTSKRNSTCPKWISKISEAVELEGAEESPPNARPRCSPPTAPSSSN